MHLAKKIGLSFVFTTLFGLLAACGGETPDRKSQVQQDSSSMTGVVIRTNKGNIELDLDQDKAPLSVANFLSYVDSGHYAGTVFHRFFINVADNAFLDHRDTSAAGYGYAVFGRVTSGQEVIDAIAAVATGAAGQFSKDVPLEPIVIESISRM